MCTRNAARRKGCFVLWLMEKAQKTLFDVEIELEVDVILRYHDAKFLFATRKCGERFY